MWIISRHYSDDQRMGSLFTRIGREVGDRVEAAVDMRAILRQSPQEAVDLLRTCRSVLEAWYSTYMQVGRGGSRMGSQGLSLAWTTEDALAFRIPGACLRPAASDDCTFSSSPPATPA